jgi:hypothetical protein
MWRNLALVMTFLALGGAAPNAPAQDEPNSNTRQPTIVEQNPVIEALIPVDRTIAAEVVLKLQRLTTGTVAPGSRAGARPSAAELEQIDDNPAFARAYQHDLDGTLALLRWVNGELALTRRQPQAAPR